MEARARAVRGAVCLAFALVALVAPASNVRAEDTRVVVIGEVGTRVTRARLDLPKALRRALERELATLDVRAAGSSKRFVLSASLVKLEGRKASPGVDCAVSAVLREQRSGAIRAIITGRAAAEFEGDEAELGAIDAAVHGAVASVPAAMR
jgi:hypothetical protein